ncbi:MAG: GerMN domain-containing protein [Bacillota bacterium]
MKLIINLLLIIIIVFSLSIIPINYDLINLDIDKQPAEEPDTQTETTYNIDIPKNINKDTFQIKVSTNKKDKLENLLDKFNLKISINNFADKNYKLNDLDINKTLDQSSNDKEEVIYTLTYDLDIENFLNKSGLYTLDISIKNEFFNKNISGEILKLKNSSYIGSDNENPENKLYAKGYYPDKNALFLIPINRPIVNNRNRYIRNSMNELLNPLDKKYGLSTVKFAPRIQNIFISEGIAYLDFNLEDVKPFNQGSAASSIARNSIIKTIGEFDTVKKVKFNINNYNEQVYFHGIDISKAFDIKTLPKAFVALETETNKLFLNPIEINEESLEEKVKSIFANLQGKNIRFDSKNIPTIPYNVKLKNYTLNDKNITLNLSKEFLNTFNNNTFNKLMYESILYSFTSLEKINTVSIKVDDNEVNDFLDMDISKPTKPNEYINTLN